MMKQKKIWLLLLVIVAAAAFAGYKIFFGRGTTDVVAERGDEPLLALYDRNDSSAAGWVGNCRSITLRWNNEQAVDFAEQLKTTIGNAPAVLITVETWPAQGKFSKENVLNRIENGLYDGKIKKLGELLSVQKAVVMLRLNPDMEVYVNRYPWQMQGAATYAKAFRHFSEHLKAVAPAVKMVWAPAGYPGTEEYWPGARWVDLVSVTLKGKSESMTDNYPEEKNMQQLIFRKLHRLRFFDKPALVIGSEKINTANFIQADFNAAVGYIRQNKAIEYLDMNAADKEKADSTLRKAGTLTVAVFDPQGKLTDSVPVTTEHIFVNLEFLKSGSFRKKFDSAVSRNHHVIVTMEPWRDKKLSKDPELMANILAGKYDSVFNQLYAVLSSVTDKTIYLRWLHEMEIPIKRYPWQSQDPLLYIKCYRYFVNFIRDKNPGNILFVWGPAGDRGSMEFWPGSDVVDYTSIAIYGLPDKNITDHNKQESFETIFKRKYRRIWFSHKPLFITEFGVKGPKDYKDQWLTAAAATIESNAEITGISYFNDADNPKAWGDIEAPDWAVTPGTFSAFLKQLKTSYRY